MLSLLSNKSHSNNHTGSLLKDLQEQHAKNQLFFKEIENWRNIELNYIAKISQIVSNLRDKSHKSNFKENSKANQDSSSLQRHAEEELYFCAHTQLAKIFQIVIDNHKSFLSKINYDVFLVNYDSSEKLLTESKKLLDEQKHQQKDMLSKRQALQKVLGKKQKLKKQRQQEQMLQIFLLDSVETTIDQKIRKKNKIKEIEKESQEYQVKVREITQQYLKISEKNKENVSRLKHNYKEQNRGKVQTLLKIQLHLNTYWKNLLSHMEQYNKETQYKECQNINTNIFTKVEKREAELAKKLTTGKVGFVQNSLKLINQNIIDQLLEYSKDKEVKTKIKRMMETNEVDPVQTDQVSRQAKLIKKMLLQEQIQKKCIQIFRGIVNKNSKLRMNFVFILQFFRINSQFEISIGQINSLHYLISQFLDACYSNRDSFVLKQLMILLMTYYVCHKKENNQIQKIYIIHFFKRNQLWKDIQYWESILLQCIYIQKKNTIKMVLVNSMSGNNNKKKEVNQAERLAILNQVLMVVRNMVIFEFSEKEVKNFAQRFIKLLKQDQKFQKDVFNTIEDAVKQETKLLQQQRESIKQYYATNLAKNTSQQFYISQPLRKSYTS